ncbi:HutD/Ves family protein [Inquilinus limosus]|uniref:HutD/Ves family protein n=1 Tax=Inquilinus limosus TaxID=171674 RepID=UPI00068A183F|nr:HutD family protein [Inquilinus limosus]
MPTRIISPAQHRLMPWRNGGGRTAEIAVEPADTPSGFRWRLSLAEVESDGPFSPFPACGRTIMLLSGRGMDLTIADPGDLPRTVRIDRPHEPFDFDGEAATSCRLVAGPVRDLNVIADRSLQIDHRVAALDDADAMLEPAPVWLFYVLRGTAVVDIGRHLAVTEGETAVITDEDDRAPHLRGAEADSLVYAVALRPR